MKFFIFFLSLFFTCTLQAQKISLPDDVRTRIEKRIEYNINPSIVLGIIHDNETAYFNYGTTQAGGPFVDEHSIFEIGSVSKVFTAILLADNVIKGEMNLDDPAQKYLPEQAHLPMYDEASITLGHLSDHTSSLPRMPSNFAPADLSNPYADYSVDQLYAFLSSCELTRSIGSEYEYSNLAVGLLGHILALKAGTTYEELLLSKIARPLHLEETKITLDQNMKSHLAYGHANGVAVSNWDLPALAGAGAIRSSSHDLLMFLAANMGLTSSPLDAAMQLSHTVRHDKAGALRVGLGWHISKTDHGDVIWHNGATGGYRAFIGFNKTDKLGVIVMTNSDQDIDDLGFHLLDPQSPLQDIKPPMSAAIKKMIDHHGSKGLVSRYKKFKKKNGDLYAINETEINALGYWYMNERKDLEVAKAIFEINILEFPNAYNVYDSYGEVLMNQELNQEAILNYKKSLEINPGNMNAVEMMAKMGEEIEMPAVVVEEEVLRTYEGTYQLAPGFNIVITRQGTQLFGQATGQSQFELFPKSETEFYLKVTVASIVFSRNAEGEVGLTLIQNGQVLPGKKI